MKLKALTKKQLVLAEASRLADSVVDDSPDDIRTYVMDLETGKTEPVCTWSKKQLQESLLNDQECSVCEKQLTIDTAYVDEPDHMLFYCKECHNDR